MKKEVVQAVNSQLAEELISVYVYLGTAVYAESTNLKGFANWYTVQAKEGMSHARGFYRYLIEQRSQN